MPPTTAAPPSTTRLLSGWIFRLAVRVLLVCLGLTGATWLFAPATWSVTYAESRSVVGAQSLAVFRIDLERGLTYPIRDGFLFWNDLQLSPDGRWIVGEVPDGNLALISARDGVKHGEPRVLAAGYSPVWSPDSSSIAYEHGGHIYVRHLLPSGFIQPAQRIAEVTFGAAIAATWSPGGDWLAFEARRFIAPASTLGELYRVRPDGRDLQLLTGTFDLPAFSPTWSPDGRYLAFIAEENAARRLWRIDLASGQFERLTDHGGEDFNAVWSPDGARIAYVSMESRQARLRVLDTRPGQRRQPPPRPAAASGARPGAVVARRHAPGGRRPSGSPPLHPRHRPPARAPHPPARRLPRAAAVMRAWPTVRLLLPLAILLCGAGLLGLGAALAAGGWAPPDWEIAYAHRVGRATREGWWIGQIDPQRRLSVPTRRGFENWEGLYPSPGGRYMAGYVTRAAGDALILFDLAGSEDAAQFVAQGFSPAWSPRLDALAFISYDAQLYAVSLAADGTPSTPRRLDAAPVASDLLRRPVWSPDGRWLAYLVQGYAGVQRDKSEIYLLPHTAATAPDAAPAQPLTAGDPDPVSDFAWSPDGARLAYVTFDGSDSRLVIVSPDAPQTRQVGGRLRAVVRGMRWSPDGASIAFYAITPTQFAVYAVSLPPRQASAAADAPMLPRLLATLPPDINQPLVWSPDSARLAFVGLDDGQVYTVRAGAGSPTAADLHRVTANIRRFALLRVD